MGELKPGERLLLADGEATVTAARIEQLAEPVTVYNFEVAGWHTYHVGSQEAGWVFVHNRCGGSSARLSRLSDRDFLTELATRVERHGVRKGWGAAGTGPKQGTLKHAYADRLLARYQRMTGQRQHLLREQSWKGGHSVKHGTKGSARPDVFDPTTGAIYDYKFTRSGRGISAAQYRRNAANVRGVTSQTAIFPG